MKVALEPFTDLHIDLNLSRTVNKNKSIQYMYQGSPTTESGSFNMTTLSLKTAFGSRGTARNGYFDKHFQDFQHYLDIFQGRVEDRYRGVRYPQGTGYQGEFKPENGTVGKYSSDVMIPAFLAAYTGGNPHTSRMEIFPALTKALPNWTVAYKGLSTLPWIRDHFKSVQLSHAYKSIYAVGSYNSFSSWIQAMTGSDLGFVENTTTGTYVPSSMYDISTVSLNESFAPLMGLSFTFFNDMTLKLEYRTTRVIALSMTSAQLNETGSKDIVLGWGYKIADFRLGSLTGGGKASQKNSKNTKKPAAKGQDAQKDGKTPGKNSTAETGSRSGKRNNFAHTLNLRFDFSLRNQDAIKRDLQTSLCEATSGSRAIKTSAAIDYTMSKMVTMSLYYDRQRSQPLLSSSSYPTITQDFGMSMKFSLTR